MRYFTSDLHLYHKNIMLYCPEYRNFSTLDEMHNALLVNFQQTLTVNDELFILGDVGFCKVSKIKEFFDQIAVGKKTLILGNHDAKPEKLSGVFDEIHTSAVITLSNGLDVNLSHYPYAPPDDADNPEIYDLRYMERRLYNDGKWLFCGHVHEKWKCLDKMINVGVDQWALTPVSETTLVNLINERS